MSKKTIGFAEMDRLKAMAVVNIFETGRPFGEYSALAVLNDGAGISYGISQFTHRSGSLHDVVSLFLESGGQAGRVVLAERLDLLRSPSPGAVRMAAVDQRLKNALRAAAGTPEMRAAQHRVAFERYLRPAVDACAGWDFVLPLSLAVVYDSMTHGSWEMIRDRVRTPAPRVPSVGFEKAWITAYVKKRHEWLRGIPRLRSTSYRTAFFLAQIIAGNWQLELPVTVHGFSLSLNNFPPTSSGDTASAAEHSSSPAVTSTKPQKSPSDERPQAFPANARPPKHNTSVLQKIEERVGNSAAFYDRFEAVIRTVLTRRDAAKSLWTTVAGTVWQAFWAIASFIIGLPREVWLAVAVIAAVLMVFYLYRQYALGRIREMREFVFLTPPAERHRSSADKNNE